MLTPDTLLQNRYRIVRQLGRGGMGAVYEATDERLVHAVAVKELLVEGAGLHRAFEREARLLAHLSHPSLPRVTDHFTEGTGDYLVMDFLPGEDLKTMLDRNGAPFAVRDVLRWADELLEVLEYLHGHEPSIIHRDIKPANLKLLHNSRIALLDFGLAKGGTGQTQATTSRSIFGYSPHFASLEQIEGERSSERSDLYSLSATLYHLLTGRMPSDALMRATAVFNEEQDPLVPLSQLNTDVPDAVARLIMSGLELKPSARPTSAVEMRARLKSASKDGTAVDNDEITVIAPTDCAQKAVTPAATIETLPQVATTPIPQAATGPQAPRAYRHILLATLALCLLAAVLLGLYFLLTSRKGRDRTPDKPPDAVVLPPQLKPASAALLTLSAIDADGHILAGGGGYFVTSAEAVLPLSAIEGAASVSVYTGGQATSRRVVSVTRVDRERGVVVIKIEGEGGAPLSVPVGAPPVAGEKVKLLGIGIDLVIHLADGSISVPNKTGLEVSTTDQTVGPGWLAFRESGELVGLLTVRVRAGGFTLFTPPNVAELMKKKAMQQPVEVAGAKDVLFDFRDTDADTDTPQLGAQEESTVFNAIFGARRSARDDSFNDCKDEERAKCLTADRAAGRIEPEVLTKVSGSFTQPSAQEVAYLIAVHEEHAAHVDNYGTKRLAIFDGQRLVVNVDIGDYWEILKTYDLNRDGTQDLLLAGSYSQMDVTVKWAKLIDLRGGKPTVVKDFDKVYLDGCASDYQDVKVFGTLILYTPAAPGAFPLCFRQDVYRSACGDEVNWKYLVNGKVPML